MMVTTQLAMMIPLSCLHLTKRAMQALTLNRTLSYRVWRKMVGLFVCTIDFAAFFFFGGGGGGGSTRS